MTERGARAFAFMMDVLHGWPVVTVFESLEEAACERLAATTRARVCVGVLLALRGRP